MVFAVFDDRHSAEAAVCAVGIWLDIGAEDTDARCGGSFPFENHRIFCSAEIADEIAFFVDDRIKLWIAGNAAAKSSATCCSDCQNFVGFIICGRRGERTGTVIFHPDQRAFPRKIKQPREESA